MKRMTAPWWSASAASPWAGTSRPGSAGHANETIAPELDAAARQAFRITVMHDIELGLLGARMQVAS